MRLAWLVVCLCVAPVAAEAPPASVEEFLALRDAKAVTPEGGAAVFLAAMRVYAKDKALGRKLLTIALDQKQLDKDASGYKGYAPGAGWDFYLQRLERDKTLPDCYTGEFSRNKYSVADDGTVKVFAACRGAASPRPVRLRKNDKGLWKVQEASSLFLGVKKPETDRDDL